MMPPSSSSSSSTDSSVHTNLDPTGSALNLADSGPPESQNDGPPYTLLTVLLTLYFAQGLPSGFITQALPAILRDYDVSLEMIGLSGLLLAPWALKFLWAPVVDQYFSPKWGRSRSWILPLQLLSAMIVAAVGLFNPQQLSTPQTLWALYALLFFLSLIGATHDVAADGLATRSLSQLVRQSSDNKAIEATSTAHNPYQGMGNAVQVIGYRLGLILGGGVFLLVLGNWSWRYSFFAMAALIVLNTLPIWRYPENKHIAISQHQTQAKTDRMLSQIGHQRQASSTSDETLAEPKARSVAHYLTDNYGYFWHNREMRAWLTVLLSFKIVDGISSGMVKPMMVDMGIPTGSIGLWVSVLGSGASLLGAALAAWLLKRMAHHTALLSFNAFQVVTTGLYVLVAIGFEHPNWLGVGAGASIPFWWAYAANAVEHMAAAMALVAMLTMVMHYARHQKAGSDFTTQVCLLTVFSGVSHLVSGFIAAQLGYSGHFVLSVAVGVLCLLPIIYWRSVFVRSATD